MAKKVEKLKKFYIANGGDASAVANIKTVGGMIDALCDIEFDSELPAVTGSDNGKVLGVVEGNWAKTDAPSYEFAVAYTEGEGDTIVADKTFAEITAAISAGKNIVASFPQGEGELIYLCLSGKTASEVTFSGVAVIETSIAAYTLTHGSDETITFVSQSTSA